MKEIIFDLDGVLADWEDGFKKQTGISHIEAKKKGKMKSYKQKMPGAGFYTLLEPMPLVKILHKYPGKFGILSATGEIEPDEIAKQKRYWLSQVLGYVPKNTYFVPKSKDKAQYAKEGILLVDDRKEALIPFSAAGGSIFHYKGSENQDKMIENLLENL